MARQNYDLREMADVFRVLARVGGAAREQGRLPEWLSTHPYPENRIAEAKELLAESPAQRVRGKESRDRYLPIVEGLVYGQNPRHGFFAGTRFFHPELRFSVSFPAEWRKVNLNQAVTAESPGGDAAAQLTVVPDAAPEVALRRFLDRAGVTLVSPEQLAISGLPAASAQFSASTDGSQVAGLATFVRHGGRTFQLLTLSRRESLASNRRFFAAIAGSFQPVADPEILSMQPARVILLEVPGRLTLAQLHQQRGGQLSVESLARLNQMSPGTMLEPGQKLKWVRGDPEPGVAFRSADGRADAR